MMMDYDDAYANAPYIAGAEHYPERWQNQAAGFRDGLHDRAKLALSYGPSERQKYDLFLPKAAPKGLCIFVHGGYWLKFHRNYWSHLAAGPLARGWAVAIPSYDLCPEVSIATITRQIAQAIEAAAAEVAGPIVLAGHSAGGHLVARMCVAGMLPAPVMARVAHVMPISPVSDLRPMLRLALNADFGLDRAMAEAESPVLMPPLDVTVTVWVGGDERPVFLDQARWLSEAWNAGHVVEENRHHFDVIEGLQDAGSKMVERLLG
jgi:acetyl esterase/lipase